MENIEENTCRICLAATELNESHGIFDIFSNELTYSDIVILITSIEIKPNDGLPTKLCKNCSNRARDAYNFRKQCINSDEILKSKTETPNIVKVEVTEGDVKTECSDDDTVEDSMNETDCNPLDETDDIVETPSRQKEKKQHTCEICFKVFDKPFILQRHLIVHKANGKEFECNVCHRFYAFEGSLINHKMTHDVDPSDKSVNNQPHDDGINDVKYIPPLEEGPIPEKPRQIRKTHKCKICSKLFDKPSRLLRHATVHAANGKEFECNICHRFFAAGSTLIRHKITHAAQAENMNRTSSSPKKPFKCFECDRIFEKQESMASHMRIHKINSTVKEYKCDYCPKVFTEINLLTRHSKSHVEMKVFKCELCPESFGSRSQLTDHTNKHTGLKPYECTICKKKFHSSTVLNQHIKIHTDDKSHLCPQCGKGFKNNGYLKQHMISHLGEKIFACPQCPSKYSTKGKLKSHLQSHSGLKPFVCELCGSSFTKHYTLTVHKRIHSGEKPFGCDACPKRFISLNHLKRHSRVHTGVKPYKCKYCERAFAQSGDLIKHTRTHIGTNTYKCDKCEVTFRLYGELKKHIQMHFLAEKEMLDEKTKSEN